MAVRRRPASGTGPIGPQGGADFAVVTDDTTKDDKNKTSKTDKTKTSKTDKTKTSKTGKPVDVAKAVKKFYPQWSYMLDNPELFGRDLINVLMKAARDKGAWTNERVAGAIQRTKYWQNTVAAAKNFDAATEADRQTLIEQTRQELSTFTDLTTMDQATLDTFARDMARRGIKGEQLRPLVYKFVFDQGAEAAAAQEALVSQNAQAIRQVASQYGQRVDDDLLQSFLEKGETAETMQRKYVAKLKAQYPQLADQLDSGLSFADITDDYKRVAAQTLEKTVDSIDFMDPKFMEAIAEPQANGTYRQLSLGEWQQKLRTDDRYGYSKTTQAVRDARTLASSIARSFGKVV